jgi:hypothetical protein
MPTPTDEDRERERRLLEASGGDWAQVSLARRLLRREVAASRAPRLVPADGEAVALGSGAPLRVAPGG